MWRSSNYTNIVTGDRLMTLDRIYLLVSSEDMFLQNLLARPRGSEWLNALMVIQNSYNHSYIHNFCCISSFLTARGGALRMTLTNRVSTNPQHIPCSLDRVFRKCMAMTMRPWHIWPHGPITMWKHLVQSGSSLWKAGGDLLPYIRGWWCPRFSETSTVWREHDLS